MERVLTTDSNVSCWSQVFIKYIQRGWLSSVLFGPMLFIGTLKKEVQWRHTVFKQEKCKREMSVTWCCYYFPSLPGMRSHVIM